MFFITWSVVVLLLLVGVLLLPKRAPTAGLLTSGAVFLYCRLGGEGGKWVVFMYCRSGRAVRRETGCCKCRCVSILRGREGHGPCSGDGEGHGGGFSCKAVCCFISVPLVNPS